MISYYDEDGGYVSEESYLNSSDADFEAKNKPLDNLKSKDGYLDQIKKNKRNYIS